MACTATSLNDNCFLCYKNTFRPICFVLFFFLVRMLVTWSSRGRRDTRCLPITQIWYPSADKNLHDAIDHTPSCPTRYLRRPLSDYLIRITYTSTVSKAIDLLISRSLFREPNKNMWRGGVLADRSWTNGFLQTSIETWLIPSDSRK